MNVLPTCKYWATGQILDSPNWNKSYGYKGLNKLGQLLEEVRDTYFPTTSSPISAARSRAQSTKSLDESRNGQSKDKSSLQSSLRASASMSGDKTVIQSGEGGSGITSAAEKGNKLDVNAVGNTPGLMIENEHALAAKIPADLSGKGDRYTDSELMEIDNISFHTTSLNASCDSQNSTSNDDSLLKSSQNKWEIPALNTSKLLNRSGFGSREKRENLQKLLQAQPGGDSFRSLGHSTPVVTVAKRKVPPIKSHHETEEKAKLDLLLDEA